MIVEKETKCGYISYYKNDFAFVNSLKSGKIYEQDLVLQKLKKYIELSNTILDIGSHAGSHTVLYKHINPKAKIYCFEPQSKMFDLLNHNIKCNNFKNVETFNVGVANISKQAEMDPYLRYGENSHVPLEYGADIRINFGGMQIGHGGEKIHTVTIDSLNLDSCDFIKIDTEGFEPLVLMGGKETIKKYKPTILFEYNDSKILKETAKHFNAEYPLPTSESILRDYGYKNIKLVDGVWNYLAVY
jgi:FkbM family methyltransferase